MKLHIYSKFFILCQILFLNGIVLNAEESRNNVLILVGTYIDSSNNSSENIDALSSATRSIKGSYSGATLEIAHKIKILLEHNQSSVDLFTVDYSNIDLTQYDLLILGSAIQGGVPHKNIRAFIESNRIILNQKEIAVFAVCASILTHNEKKRAKAESFADSVAYGLDTSSKIVFAGHVPDLGWLPTKITKLFLGIKKVQTGDHINWGNVESWTNSLIK